MVIVKVMALKISRILHAGYIFESEGTQIAFDPIFENPFSHNCYAYPAVEFNLKQIKELKWAAIFISHFHDDHFSLESLNLIDRKTPIYAYCIFEQLFDLLRELGFEHVYSLKLDQSVTIGSFEVIPRRALDVDVDSMFQVKAQGLNVLNVVDSWIDDDTLDQLAQTNWDMVLWPFQTMLELPVIAPSRAPAVSTELPVEWISQLTKLSPRYVVPSSCQFVQESWSWYNHAFFPISYRQFEKEMALALPQAGCIRLDPSVSMLLTKENLTKTAPLVWINLIGPQNVDYELKVGLKPPTTAHIAKHFPKLTTAQEKTVYDFCESGLIEKFQSLEASHDDYFEKPRLWKLAIYDHLGNSKFYFYEINLNRVRLANDSLLPLGWLTEISVSKIYAALKLGESLTSMYIRINDIVFEDSIENEISNADIVEDPLIRCLFNAVPFGAYQRAQLQRIKSI